MRQWLLVFALLGILGGGARPLAAGAPDAVRVPFETRHFFLERLADGVWAAIHNDEGGWAICNGGIIDLGDRTVVIDPFMTPAAARDLKRAAEHLTGRAVTLVINTHRHNDHVRGNQVFVPGAGILGSSSTRRQMLEFEPRDIADERKEAPAALAAMEERQRTATGLEARNAGMFAEYFRGMLASHDELVVTPPDLLVDREMTVQGSVRRLEVRVLGRSHTDSDLVVVLPDQGIIFMGDLLFVERHPFLGDGNATDLVQVLRKIQGWPIRVFVPGHGPVAGPDGVATMIAYVETLQELAVGRSPEAAAALPVPAAYAGWTFGQFFPANMAFLARQPP